jgi:hypothetical protein
MPNICFSNSEQFPICTVTAAMNSLTALRRTQHNQTLGFYSVMLRSPKMIYKIHDTFLHIFRSAKTAVLHILAGPYQEVPEYLYCLSAPTASYEVFWYIYENMSKFFGYSYIFRKHLVQYYSLQYIATHSLSYHDLI